MQAKNETDCNEKHSMLGSLRDAYARAKWLRAIPRDGWQPPSKHPMNPGERIFLLFDPVHIFKNYYNNFVNRKYFECPDFDGTVVKPNMQHIREIYTLELLRSVKIAHRLSDKVLNHASIEKSNVSLTV